MKPQIRVIVCRVGQRPTIEFIDAGLESMQALVGGYVDCLQVAEHNETGRIIDVWCNDEGLLNGSQPNRLVEGKVPICGDFFIAASDEGETVSLTNDEALHWAMRANLWPIGLGFL